MKERERGSERGVSGGERERCIREREREREREVYQGERERERGREAVEAQWNELTWKKATNGENRET